jgi:membrane dipeptidase
LAKKKARSTKFVVFDGHNDALTRSHRHRSTKSFLQTNSSGHLDLPRAKKGGFGGGFFAVMAPVQGTRLHLEANGASYLVEAGSPISLEQAQKTAMEASALLFRLEKDSKGQMKVVRNVKDLQECLESGVLAAILHFEGAEPIDPGLDSLEVYYEAGLRSLGLAWSRPNIFAQGVPFIANHPPDTGPGLTKLGRQLVKACNQMGVMVDLSHLNEKGFWDVAKISQAPLVATHSNAFALSPATRNLTDKQLDAIADSDGMVGVNFATGFLRKDGSHKADASLATLVDHVDYLIDRIGIDRVGFGSDFDGAKIPSEIKDVTGLPKLIDALRARGHDDDALRKLAHGNWVRVLAKTWH